MRTTQELMKRVASSGFDLLASPPTSKFQRTRHLKRLAMSTRQLFRQDPELPEICRIRLNALIELVGISVGCGLDSSRRLSFRAIQELRQGLEVVESAMIEAGAFRYGTHVSWIWLNGFCGTVDALFRYSPDGSLWWEAFRRSRVLTQIYDTLVKLDQQGCIQMYPRASDELLKRIPPLSAPKRFLIYRRVLARLTPEEIEVESGVPEREISQIVDCLLGKCG